MLPPRKPATQRRSLNHDEAGATRAEVVQLREPDRQTAK